MMTPLNYSEGVLYILDQRLLPRTEVWVSCHTLDDVADCIKTMKIRGAPAIGCAAAFGLALAAQNSKKSSWGSFQKEFAAGRETLAATRPTAVNLFQALDTMTDIAAKFAGSLSMGEATERLLQEAKNYYDADIEFCRTIGRNALSLLRPGERIRALTHCNAGALATAGYGTALGVLRSLAAENVLDHVYVDETRPWLQGARLTAYELAVEGIAHNLIVEGAAASLMRQGLIDWVVVGADRIAGNGDVANKIGTYSLAVLARHHGIKFYVAAPLTTFDCKIFSGADIPIESRNSSEVTGYAGTRIAPEKTVALNPSFDVTPADLVDGIITEKGIFTPPLRSALRAAEVGV